MSGGHFNYKQNHIRDIVDEIESIIENNKTSDYKYDSKTIVRFIEGVKALRIAETYAQRIDWLLSDDDGEESFWQRLDSDLKKII